MAVSGLRSGSCGREPTCSPEAAVTHSIMLMKNQRNGVLMNGSTILKVVWSAGL